MSAFLKLSYPALHSIADALETGQLRLPVTPVAICTYVFNDQLPEVVAELNNLYQHNMTVDHIAYILKLLAVERAVTQKQQDQVNLVWTGPEAVGSASRDTSVVVRELFSSAKSSVLISSFAIDSGIKGQQLLQPLAAQMDANPNLSVRMFLNIKRSYNDKTPAQTLLRQFAEEFRQRIWVGQRLPEVFHDPRSLEFPGEANACLHAKCIVVDEEQVFITSANFTEAAHRRNIEVGLLLVNQATAKALRSQFEVLVTQKILKRVAGL